MGVPDRRGRIVAFDRGTRGRRRVIAPRNEPFPESSRCHIPFGRALSLRMLPAPNSWTQVLGVRSTVVCWGRGIRGGGYAEDSSVMPADYG